ncbi:MAG: hypothetical protein AB7F22_07755 [Reyranella sp.]|uniref:hypothetical protein n=1 Tax=Reyranella sp. TaxID=1929291 RepID=UPI003D0D9CD5
MNTARFWFGNWAIMATAFLVLLVAACTPEPAHAQGITGRCIPIPKEAAPVEEPFSPAALHEGFLTGGPVVWWRPLAQEIVAVSKVQAFMPYRAIVVTEHWEPGGYLMTIYLISVNLDRMCGMPDVPAKAYWDWRNALIGRPA